MGAPSARVEVGFGSTWRTADIDIVWTDITCRVNDGARLLATFRGATAAHGMAGAGTADFTLNNADRRFDPLNTAGPHYGQLLPGVPVRVIGDPGVALLTWMGEPLEWMGEPVVDTGSTEVPIYRGFITAWPQSPMPGNTMTRVEVSCVDGFQNLARTKAPESVYDLEVLADAPKAYWKLTDPTPELAADSSGNGYGGLYRNEPEPTDGSGLVYATPARTFNGSNQVVSVGDTAARLHDNDGDLTIEAWFRTSATAASGLRDTIWVQAGDAGANYWLHLNDSGQVAVAVHGSEYGDFMFRSDDAFNDGEAHHVVFRSTYESGFSPTLSLKVDDVEVGTLTAEDAWIAASGMAIGGHPNPRNSNYSFSGDISHVALYESHLSDARVSVHYDAGTAPWADDTSDERLDHTLDAIEWPADLRSFETGRSTLGPATFENDWALDYLRLVEVTEGGRLFIDTSGSLRFHDRLWPHTATAGTTSQATFTDVAGGNGYQDFEYVLDDELVINAVSYSRRGGETVRIDNDASQDLHGIREDRQSDLLLRTDAEVRSRAHWTITTRHEALPRVKSIVIPLHAYEAADQAAVLDLDLGYRVSTVRTPQGVGDPIELDFTVDGIQHRIGATEWWVELYVSPAPDTAVTLFTLGTSTLGGTHVLAH